MDQWGPFRPDIDEAERRACLRGLRAIARLLAGPRAASLCNLLAQAEVDATALEPACHALNALAGTDKRRILASYGVLTAPARPPRGSPNTEGRA